MVDQSSMASTNTESENNLPSQSPAEERILCQHCRRTATNGIRCLGMCVADNDY
ncbi:MAG: hypothetical protein VXZ59_00955 [Cyanobacteriota bacterium]|nr:hypothetical protein [Cyanobacteriota bacterium]